MAIISYDDRYFAPVTTTPNGEVGSATLFHYHQQGIIVWATYKGGNILFGTLLALADEDGRLDMRYQQVNLHGTLMTGRCKTVPEVLPDGRLRLHEAWTWTSGDGSSGTSIVEEVHPPDDLGA